MKLYITDTVDGAHASAIIYSIIQTAKKHDIKYFQYKYVLEKFPAADSLADYKQLLKAKLMRSLSV